jgi:hypothetical protein
MRLSSAADNAVLLVGSEHRRQAPHLPDLSHDEKLSLLQLKRRPVQGFDVHEAKPARESEQSGPGIQGHAVQVVRDRVGEALLGRPRRRVVHDPFEPARLDAIDAVAQGFNERCGKSWIHRPSVCAGLTVLASSQAVRSRRR